MPPRFPIAVNTLVACGLEVYALLNFKVTDSGFIRILQVNNVFAHLFNFVKKIISHCSIIGVTVCLIKLIYVTAVTFAVLFFTEDCRGAERS